MSDWPDEDIICISQKLARSRPVKLGPHWQSCRQGCIVCSLCLDPGDEAYEDHAHKHYDSDEEFHVQRILDERIGDDGERWLLPKWTGFELDPHAWQPAAAFDNTDALMVRHSVLQIGDRLCPDWQAFKLVHVHGSDTAAG